jgi:hypothetical protein
MPNGLWQWLRQAFAIESAEACAPTDRQQEICDRLLKEIARRGMTVPALLWLETSRPLNYVGAQLMHFCEPVLSAVCDAAACREFALFLERPGAIEYLCRRLEELSGAKSPLPEKSPPATG